MITLSSLMLILEGLILYFDNFSLHLSLNDYSNNNQVIDIAKKNLDNYISYMDNQAKDSKVKWFHTKAPSGEVGLRFPENYKPGNEMSIYKNLFTPFKETQLMQVIYDVTFERTTLSLKDLKQIIRANCYDKETCKFIIETYITLYKPVNDPGIYVKTRMIETIEKVLKSKKSV